MDAMLNTLVRRVLAETHQEHLVDRIVGRVLSAIRMFHNRPENFAEDSKDATFEVDTSNGSVYEEVANLGSLIGLRKVLTVIVYLQCGEEVEARVATTALEYFRGGAGGSSKKAQAYALRIGGSLKVKCEQPMVAFTVIYNAPPVVTENVLGTWLSEQQLEFAVSDAIGFTFEQIGDDAAPLYIRRSAQELTQLVAGLDKL